MLLSAVFLASLSSVAAQLVIQPQHRNNTNEVSRTIPIDVGHLFNNRGFGKSGGDANFDGAGQGQTIDVPKGRYLRVSMLAAAEDGLAEGSINATYEDGSLTPAQVLVPSWWSWPYPFGGDLVMPYHFANQSVDYNRSNIFQTTNWLDPTKELTSLTLPIPKGAGSGVGGGEIETKLHIFAISLLPVTEAALEDGLPQLEVQYARTTQKWIEGTDKTQIVEVIVNNVGATWLLSNQTVTVSVDSPGLKTVSPVVLKRLRPGDQVIVEVGVVNNGGVAEGSKGPATIVLQAEDGRLRANIRLRLRPRSPPEWFNNGKFGIFIHWGVFAVPGWGDVGPQESYAEWYWWYLSDAGKDNFRQHHLDTYGPDVVYDDFIVNFTAEHFSSRDWVDLFADSGAQYFVQTSKHHDGYAIFDVPANISGRTSVALTPHRDILAELFAAAREYQPHLHPAAYFSLPEWFHPDYEPLGFGSWPGGNATNPFTNASLSYTGYVPLGDGVGSKGNFVADLIVPEMNTLGTDPRYEVEIMWCDIGGPNATAEFAARWYNHAAAAGRQVSMNARCGLPGDFDTPEYASYSAAQRRKWESSAGMDPFSYGYNRATPDAAYMNASTIVTTLLDIVSKNGNFLLDIGPTETGEIVEVEKRNLREAGAWIKDHAEAVFNTTYWGVTPQYVDAAANTDVRFTMTMDAFYLSVLNQTTDGSVEIRDTPIPWIETDKVTIVGGQMAGQIVNVESLGESGVRLNITQEMWEADKWAWSLVHQAHIANARCDIIEVFDNAAIIYGCGIHDGQSSRKSVGIVTRTNRWSFLLYHSKCVITDPVQHSFDHGVPCGNSLRSIDDQHIRYPPVGVDIAMSGSDFDCRGMLLDIVMAESTSRLAGANDTGVETEPLQILHGSSECLDDLGLARHAPYDAVGRPAFVPEDPRVQLAGGHV
ncbi:glycoside hydrolase [Apiospora aurea]|uniref:alpha-L-fucosidase n=1 Tax=Apiospora aurea TaxID=335848 RepID=A0ABR1PZE2_9PEZI